MTSPYAGGCAPAKPGLHRRLRLREACDSLSGNEGKRADGGNGFKRNRAFHAGRFDLQRRTGRDLQRICPPPQQAHAQAIAEGKVTALQESSTEFVTKASGIENRYVMDKAGILDPDIMCPRIPERANDKLSILAEMAVTAARDALKASDRNAADIDGVLVACSNLQRAYPAIAVEVQDALGIDGFAFDMNVACSSATFGLQAAADMIAAGHARAILVCNPEICSGHLNFRDRDSHFIFGDVATAFVVEPTAQAVKAPMRGKSSRPGSRPNSPTTSATISASSIAPRPKASARPTSCSSRKAARSSRKWCRWSRN
jgi:3-oxoacyl-[acyl-carrier-protein] synthase III